jgi:hypothetical protein
MAQKCNSQRSVRKVAYEVSSSGGGLFGRPATRESFGALLFADPIPAFSKHHPEVRESPTSSQDQISRQHHSPPCNRRWKRQVAQLCNPIGLSSIGSSRRGIGRNCNRESMGVLMMNTRRGFVKLIGQASVSRDVFPPTPPGPEGSNGNGLLRVQ